MFSAIRSSGDERWLGREKGSEIVLAGAGSDDTGLIAAHGINFSALNGCAVFAHKHALVVAHASRGGKRKRGFPTGGLCPLG